MNNLSLVGLHNHTCTSDGLFSPQQLTAHAQQQGYQKLAISDHNTIHGWLDLDLPKNVVGAIELSGICPDTGIEIHFLGYHLTLTAELLAYSQLFADLYEAAWQATLQNLGTETLSKTLSQRGQAIQDLINLGIHPQMIVAEWLRVQNVWRGENQGLSYLSCADAVAMLRRAGAFIAIAHPQRYARAMNEDLIDRVDALEVYHPSHNPEIRQFWRDIAVRLDKQVTGGHDFHGWNQPHCLPTPLALTDERLFIP